MTKLWRKTMMASAALVFALAQSAYAEPITIGAIGPLSGPAANSGIAMKQAFQYVVRKANQDGGIEIDGEKRKIELLFEDDQSQPALGVAAATKLLTRDQVDILFGSMFHSSVTLAIMDLVPSFPDTFFMSGQGVSIEIAQKIKEHPERFENFWKGIYNSDAYGNAVWESIHSLIEAGKIEAGDKRIAFIVEDTDYGRSNAEYARTHFVDHGWTVAMYGAVPLGHADFYPQITRLKANPPDVLVSNFTAVNSGTALVKQMQEKKLNIPHMAIYYPLLAEFQDGVPEAAANGLLWTPLHFDPAHSEEDAAFAKAFEETMGVEATGDHTYGVCVMGNLLYNIKRADSVDVDPLVEAFKTSDYECVNGRRVYNVDNHTPKTGPDYVPLPVAQIRGGKSVVIWPSEIASADYESPSQ